MVEQVMRERFADEVRLKVNFFTTLRLASVVENTVAFIACPHRSIFPDGGVIGRRGRCRWDKRECWVKN